MNRIPWFPPAKMVWACIWSKIPRLVWPGQEIDAHLHFEGPIDLKTIWAFEDYLRKQGICFDTRGGEGRAEWWLDESLWGPLRVKFRGHAAKPKLRAPRAVLVVDNKTPAEAGEGH